MRFRRLAALLLCLLLTLPAAAAGEPFDLRGRDCGPCRKLLGNIEILVVIVNTPQHPWTQKQRDEVYRISYSSVDYLKKEARAYHANVQYQLGFLEFTVSTEFGADLAWYWEIIHNVYHEDSIARVNARYRQDLHVDDAPMIFMFNSWDLSHTYTCSTDYPYWNEEFCVIFCDTKMHDRYLNHELYHQYGAIDLYDYHGEGVARVAEKYFPRSTMGCTGPNMDDLTAYLVGWTDQLSAKARKFLQETEGKR